jgi:starch phosphorylase
LGSYPFRLFGATPVAYFAAEFGIHESIPVYAGGLGVLSGDHIKGASDLGVPLVGVGLFYSQGYFTQHLTSDGYQQEEYLDTKVDNLPLEPARGADRNPIIVGIEPRSAGCSRWLNRSPGKAFIVLIPESCGKRTIR